MNFWDLSPIEHLALVKASHGDLTEEEQEAEEAANQKKIAAALGIG